MNYLERAIRWEEMEEGRRPEVRKQRRKENFMGGWEHLFCGV